MGRWFESNRAHQYIRRRRFYVIQKIPIKLVKVLTKCTPCDLFVRVGVMKDFPILTKKVISDNEILFEFDCGDLWYRKNAYKSEDIDKSIDLFKKELPALKGKKFEKLNLKMKYTAPHSLQLDELKEGSDNKYKVEDVNYHILYPLIYGDEDFGTELNAIAKYCHGSCQNIFGEDRLKSNPEFLFDYDILTWMNTGVTTPLKNYKLNKKSKIKFSLTQEQFDVLEDKLDIFGHNKIGRSQAVNWLPHHLLWRKPSLQASKR